MILVVEDNPTIRLVIKKTLEKEGFEVIDAENGIVAFNIIKNRKPELVISDIVMPEMDGFELITKIRKEFKDPLTPFIFVTVKDEVEDYIKGYELGADDYIAKPFQGEKLVSKVKKRLNRARIIREFLDRKRDKIYLKDVGFMYVTDAIKSMKETIELSIKSGGNTGYVYFENGEVKKVEYNNNKGKDALSRLLILKEGEIIRK